MRQTERQLLLWGPHVLPAFTVRLAFDSKSFSAGQFSAACGQVDRILDVIASQFPGATIANRSCYGRSRVVRLAFGDQDSAQRFARRLGDSLTVHLGGKAISIPITARIDES